MIQIPCETIVRHAQLVQHATDPLFQVLRLENGLVISSDRHLLAAEEMVHKWVGTYHLRLTDALVEQCRTEAALSGVVHVVPNDMLKFTAVKTSYGWSSADNLGEWSDLSGGIGRWREVIGQTATPLTEPPAPGTAMVWSAKCVARLASVAPSGKVSFERIIDPARPALMRDIETGSWVGCWLPSISDGIYHPPAELPAWLRGGAQ